MFTSSILVVLCITSLVAAVQQQQKPSPFLLKSFEMTPVVAAPQAAGAWCPTCIQFANGAFHDLLEIIVNVGIVGSCGEVCGKLNNPLEAKVCSVICDIVGIEGFIRVLKSVQHDFDPIYLCEELQQCPINDHAKANVTMVDISPKSGPVDTTFTVTGQIQIQNTIGTGELVVAYVPPSGDGAPFGGGELLVNKPPGLYNVKAQLVAAATKEEPYHPGVYHAVIEVCEGTCGSKYAHSFTLSARAAAFSITK